MSKKNQSTDNTQVLGDVINQVLAGSEQIQTEIDAKQIELEAKQKELEKCLAILERKKQLSTNRQKFLSTDGNLLKVFKHRRKSFKSVGSVEYRRVRDTTFQIKVAKF